MEIIATTCWTTLTTYLTPLGTALRGGNPDRIPVRRQPFLPLPLPHDHGLLLAQTGDLVLEADHLLLERRDLRVALAQEGLRLLVGYRHDGRRTVAGGRLVPRPSTVEVRSEAADAGVLEHIHGVRRWFISGCEERKLSREQAMQTRGVVSQQLEWLIIIGAMSTMIATAQFFVVSFLLWGCKQAK
jgi:hypothetical protein